jgi:hypothetical protein
MLKQGSNPRFQQPGGQVLCFRPHSHWDWHKQGLHWLLRWLTACIHFGCDFCLQFHYSISLITACNKSYCDILHMPDFQAGRLKCLKMKDFILPATNELASDRTGFSLAWSCALPFKIHCSIVPTTQLFRLCLARTLTLPVPHPTLSYYLWLPSQFTPCIAAKLASNFIICVSYWGLKRRFGLSHWITRSLLVLSKFNFIYFCLLLL